MANDRIFADVILPLPLPKFFVYSVPENFVPGLAIGKRVIVQFGRKKYYTAIIVKLHNQAPVGYDVKEISSVLDERPVVNVLQLQFWQWISEYYMCAVGEVMKSALPLGLKLESETYLCFNPLFENFGALSEKESLLLEQIRSNNNISIKKLSGQLHAKNFLPAIMALYEKNAILMDETLAKGFVPKKEIYVRLTAKGQNEEFLNNFLDKLKHAKKQQILLYDYIKLSGIFEKHVINEVTKKQLLESSKTSFSILKTLVKKGVFELYNREISRLGSFNSNVKELPLLSEPQQKALEDIQIAFGTKNVILLHGVTASGKTEIYFHLIKDVLAQGKQILYLMPEIAVTAQMINRLRNHFGDRVGVYHSKYSDNERVEIWNRLNSPDGNGYQVILGVRSSVFLPFNNLGLIIIDEEHETTFKQTDTAPRYHARDAAIMLAKLHSANVLLGTATPSIESYFNALSGKFGLVTLNERYKGIMLPEVKLINLGAVKKKGKLKPDFSTILIDAIENCLNKSKQVIIFQNRRGFSHYIECRECGWIPRCQNCDVTLTYHKSLNKLVCHYCGFSMNMIHSCPKCNTSGLQTISPGTEKIEEELAIFFPSAKIARMDLDSTRSKNAYEKIITDFECKKIDILVGTQMITKGFDFSDVGLAVILNADLMLNYPDFRAYERSYDLMVQVSGRAGRKAERGIVVIQTYSPGLPIIRNIINNDFIEMYNSQVEERKQFQYPPFYRLIKINVKHRKAEMCVEIASRLASGLRTELGNSVLGPDKPLIEKIQNFYIRNLMIKIERNISTVKIKQQISNGILKICKEYKSAVISIDVDPV